MSTKLGILDWGIGGVSIYKLIKEKRPDVPVIYFSDTGATPYGKMERRELAAVYWQADVAVSQVA